MSGRFLSPLFAVLFSFLCLSGNSQSTMYTPSSVANNCASWLLNLNPSSGTGRVSHLNGEMGALSLHQTAKSYVDSLSFSALYNNTAVFNAGLAGAANKTNFMFKLSSEMGGNFLRAPESFAWALIEPENGIYNYRLTDTIVKYGNNYNVNVLGTLHYYTDSASLCNDSVTSGCPLFDEFGPMYFINNDRTGMICNGDTARYKLFVENLVERYDGDGNNDMPGLIYPILYWEVNNEPEGGCANGMSAQQYGESLRMSYAAIKSACPLCQVINGGTLGGINPSDQEFWDSVFTYYYPYIDIANIHINAPKSEIFDFDWMTTQLDWIKNAETTYGFDWDVWITEWGIYSGSPYGATQTPMITEEDQAARYAKMYSYGLANDITQWFFDQSGDTISGIGSSALVYHAGPTKVARLSLYTTWLYNSKFTEVDSAKIDMFSTDPNFSTGLIRVYKNGIEYDIAWGLNSLPGFISGNKKITDIYGNETIQDVNTLTFPLSSNPIIIEPGNTAVNENYETEIGIYPNPNNGELNISNSSAIAKEYQIFDSTGRVVKTGELSAGEQIIDINSLDSGIYFIRIAQKTTRFILSK